MNEEQHEQAMDGLFVELDWNHPELRDELDAQTAEYERVRDDERA